MSMSIAVRSPIRARVRTTAEPARLGARPIDCTLLELVEAVGEVTEDDREVVATVRHMLHSRSVRLCGCFRDAPLTVFDD